MRHLLKPIIFGVATGDALGFPLQFWNRETCKRNPVVGMGEYLDDRNKIQSYAKHEVGLWSDDTSLTLCLAESLKNGFDLKDQAQRFVDWLYHGYMSALDDAFDQGIQTSRSLRIVKEILEDGANEALEDLANDDEESTNGNGSLMRILPLILYIKDMPPHRQYSLILKASALTHPHSRAALCCFYYLKMAEYIIKGKDKMTAYLQARQDTKKLMQELECKQIEFDELHRLLNEDITKLHEDEIDSGGYVVSSLEASLWCFLNTDNFADAVLKAVNLGGDADTTGAITGGIAALAYGYDAIPREWIEKLQKLELLEEVARG